nr:MAG TPA: hypothetical protein [Caudoviricetes sp.]
MIKLYYRKIEGNRDLPADDRTSQQLQQHVFTFHKKLSQFVGSPYIF